MPPSIVPRSRTARNDVFGVNYPQIDCARGGAAAGLWRHVDVGQRIMLRGETFAEPDCDSLGMAGDRALSDSALLAAVASGGDLGSLRELYDRHAPWLSVRLARRCNDRDVVADVLQDTFVALWKGAERWRGDGDVAAWMWGIAIRRLVSRLRGRRSVLVIPLEAGSAVWRTVRSAEESVLTGVEYGDLGSALARLSPEMRSVVQATVLDGLTTREAATLLGVPESTVKTRLRRAKAHLRVDLTEGLS
jgi:RNA polymerase sigma factor (sigma-70 family)